MLMVGLCSHNLRKSSCCAEATGTVGTAGAFTNEEACHLVFGSKLFVQGGSGKTCKDERRPLLGDISLGAVAGRQQPRRSKGYHKLSVKYLYIGYQPGFIAPLRPESVHIIRHLLRMQWKWLPRVSLRYSSWTKMGVCTVCDGIHTSTWWKGINLCLFLVISIHSKYKSFLFTLRDPPVKGHPYCVPVANMLILFRRFVFGWWKKDLRHQEKEVFISSVSNLFYSQYVSLNPT